MAQIFLDVEPSENWPDSLQLVFSALEGPKPVRQVRLYHQVSDGALYEITGWTLEGRPCPAFSVAVEDSGQGRAYLIYGGNGGIRMRPPTSDPSTTHPWSLDDPAQWGESHMLLSDAADII
jgi:hypothetical protein